MTDPVTSGSSTDGTSSADLPPDPSSAFRADTANSVQQLPAEPGSRPDAGLVLAALWLACSLVFGLWLMLSSHSIASQDVGMRPIATTSSQAYGGDAYTGIQNATANTANGVRKLAVFEDANARIGRRVSSRANMGIGFIVIAIGVVNFNMAFKRRAPLSR